MSLLDIEDIYRRVGDLSELDRAALMEMLDARSAPLVTCSTCEVARASVCYECVEEECDEAFENGVSEASAAAESAIGGVTRKTITVVK